MPSRAPPAAGLGRAAIPGPGLRPPGAVRLRCCVARLNEVAGHPHGQGPDKGNLCGEAPSRLLSDQTARQRPDLSTIIWVEPSSTDGSPFGGARTLRDGYRGNTIYEWAVARACLMLGCA
jgi:hypothetical protein